NTTGSIPPGATTIVTPTGLEQKIVTGIGTMSGTLVAGGIVNIAVDRDGVHGSDTNTATLTFHGVRLRYTARRILSCPSQRLTDRRGDMKAFAVRNGDLVMGPTAY